MPDVRPLADDVCICAFVPPERLAELAPNFSTIINNRPDAEEPGQPSSAEIEAEARRLGLDYTESDANFVGVTSSPRTDQTAL